MSFNSGMKGADVVALLKNGLPIVDSVDKLDANAVLGSIACVVEEGSISEVSFKDLYQPDASIADINTGAIDLSNCSQVDSIKITAPTAPIPLGGVSISGDQGLYFVNEGVSLGGSASGKMAILAVMPNAALSHIEGAMGVVTDLSSYQDQQYVLWTMSDDGVITADQEQIDAFCSAVKGLFYVGDFMSIMMGAGTTSIEYLNLFDHFAKAVAGVPSEAYIYYKKDSWEELYKKDLDKLYTTVDNHNTTIAALDSKIPTQVSQLENDSNYISKKNYIETTLTSFKDGYGKDHTGLHIQDNTTYFITTPIDDNATIYLNDETNSTNSNIDIILFSKGYKLNVIVGNVRNNNVFYASEEIDYDIGFFKISISYSTFPYDNGNVNKGMTVSVSRTKIQGHVYIGSTSETTFTDNYANRKPRVFLDGVLLKHGDTIPEKENAVFLTYGSTNCYESGFGISSLKELYVSATVLRQYGTIKWSYTIGTLKLASMCKSINNDILKCADNVYIYSISDWLQHVKIDGNALFKSNANLYIKNSLWTGLIPSDVKYISSQYIIDNVNIQNIVFEGTAPYMKGFHSIYSKASNIMAKSISDLRGGHTSNGVLNGNTIDSWFANPITSNAQRTLRTLWDRWINGEPVVCYMSGVGNFGGIVLEKITIKNCCVIEVDCFHNSSLRRVNIENVDLVSAGAFSGCQNLEVVTCNNILEINPTSLFIGCTSLQYIDFSSSTLIPVLSANQLNIPSTCKIIVPDALYDEWIAATNWSTLEDYIIKKSDWDASQVTE